VQPLLLERFAGGQMPLAVAGGDEVEVVEVAEQRDRSPSYRELGVTRVTSVTRGMWSRAGGNAGNAGNA